MLPFSAYASDDVATFNFPFSQPQVTDYSGYMEVLFESSGGSRYVRLFQWQTTPSSQMIGTEKILTNVTVNSNGLVNIKFDYPESTFYAVVSIYNGQWAGSGYFEIWQDVSVGSEIAFNLDYDDNIVSFNIYGSYTNLTSDLVPSYLPKFSVTYGDDTSLSDVTSKLTEINNNLLQLHSDNVLLDSELKTMIQQLNDLTSSVGTHLTQANWWLNYISDQINAFADRVDEDTEYIKAALKNIMDSVKKYLPTLDTNLNWLKQYVQYTFSVEFSQFKNDTLNFLYQFYLMLTDKPKNNLESPDTSHMDGYIDSENELLQNDVDMNEVVKVEVNQNALTVIWDLVQGVFDQSGKVFGMVLTVLSLGLVAMVLGRKV